MMKLAVTVNGWLDEELMYAQQLGASQVIAQAGPEPVLENWGIPKLAALRNRVEKAGLELLGLDYPLAPINQAIRGEANLEQVADRFLELITNAGTAGIGLIAYRWEDPLQHWDRLSAFLERVVPVAEEKNVRLAGNFYPETSRGGWEHQTYDLLLNIRASPNHGLDLNPDLLRGQSGSAQLHALLQPGFCDRVFLMTLNGSLSWPVPVPHTGDNSAGLAALFSIMEILYKAGRTASVRPGRPAGIPESADIEYQEQAYACGILRALLQTLEYKG